MSISQFFFFFLPQTAILNQGSLGPSPTLEMSRGIYDCWDFDAKWMDGAMLLAFSGQRPEKCWRGTRQPFKTKSWHNLLQNINASKKSLSKIPHCLSLEWRLLILTQDYLISTLKKIYFNYRMIVHVFDMHIRAPQGPGMSDSLELVIGAGNWPWVLGRAASDLYCWVTSQASFLLLKTTKNWA